LKELTWLAKPGRSFYNSHEKSASRHISAGIGVAKPFAHLSRAAAVPTHGFGNAAEARGWRADEGCFLWYPRHPAFIRG
jgi:hypothetical protein